MMCDKPKNYFIKLEQRENFKTKTETENLTNTIISQNTINTTNTTTNRSSKFNKTKSLKNKKFIYTIKDQPQQLIQQQNMTIAKTNCVEQQQQQQQQTIIGKVFQQEVSMAQQALKQTQMTLKQYFEYSNHIAATSVAAAIQTATETKRLNKQKYVQQKQQQQQQINQNSSNNSNYKNALSTFYTSYELVESTITKTSDPTAIVCTTNSSIPSTTTAGMAITLISPAIGYVENSQINIQQCDNVCIHSKCSSKQKCVQQQQTPEQQQQHQRHCKSANICSIMDSNNNNIIDIRTSSNNITIPTDITKSAATTTTATNTAITNITTSITTTNKANISSNTISTTTTPATIHPASTATTSTTPTYCKAFPLRRFYHDSKQLECLLRTVIFSFMFIMSMQYQTVSASASMLSKHEPMFISRSETFKFVAGDTIILPCEVANTDPYVVAWKRGIAILTAGSVKVTPDPRVRLVNGFNLQIRDAVPQDAGDYICQIATMEPREITHTVEILVPPRIHHISTSGHLQVKKGSSVRIECSASGNPTPNVTWSRKNNILPNGEEKLHSHILSIENVDRHKGGVYICTANNGVGQPASSQVVLHVLYPPEINVERPVVFSGEGHEAMLVCIVHGETQPEVIWFKDTMQLDTTERHIMENRGSRHTLIIRKVHTQDFGNYSCVAENQLGKSRKTLQLSGKPNVAVFNSPPISQYKDRYNISWTVESHTPIEEYKLSFRRLQQGQEVDNSIDSHSSSASSSSSMLQMYGSGGMGAVSGGSLSGVNLHNYRGGISSSSLNSMGNMAGGGYGSYGAGNVIHWGRNDWRDVVLPAIPTSHHYTQGMSYMIRGLDPDQHYEATVQARNRFGWSEYSQSFVFSTSSNDNEMRDLSVTFYGSKSSRLDIKSILLLLILAVFLCVPY